MSFQYDCLLGSKIYQSSQSESSEKSQGENHNIRILESITPILCGKCSTPIPRLLCQCKTIKYCNKKCQDKDVNHKLKCVNVISVKSNKDIISKITEQIQTEGFSNTPYYFKYKSDTLTSPPRNFRIINNSERRPLLYNKTIINFERILAYDETISEELVTLISNKFRGICVFGNSASKNKINEVKKPSPFQLLSPQFVNLRSSK